VIFEKKKIEKKTGKIRLKKKEEKRS